MMDFYTALKQVEERQKIQRTDWGDIYVDLQGGILSIHNDDTTASIWEISISDMTADDWIIYGLIQEGEVYE